MPTLTPGNDIVVIKPTLWWAPRGTRIPNVGMPLAQDWATRVDPNWTKIRDTMNGIQVTNRNPMIPIVSEERDRIGSIRAGGAGGGRGSGGGGRAAAEGSGVAIAFQALTFSESFWLFANQQVKKSKVAQVEKVEFKFATGVTTNGNVSIGLGAADGLTTTVVNVAVTSATQATATALATAVAAATYTGWTAAVSGTDPTTVVFTSTLPGPRGAHSFNANTTGATVAATYPKVTQGGHYGYSATALDPDTEHTMMIGFEGTAKAGGLFATDQIIRGFGYRCENTQNGIDVWRRTGADALIKPNLVLECIPEDSGSLTTTIAPAGTGIDPLTLDEDGKFNYFYTPVTGP